MTSVVRRRAEARWLPSRFNFALFRLFALIRLRVAKREERQVMFVIDRHQSAAETYLVATWLLATVSCFFAAPLAERFSTLVAAMIAVPLGSAALHVLFCSVGLFVTPAVRKLTRMPERWTLRFDSAVVMLGIFVSALYFAIQPSWVRIAAWQFLLLFALNAIVAIAFLPFRPFLARLEVELGGEPFGG
ncbi:MAG TPA: hypothetical protein VF701_01575 [Thermoanaerobaculia bacterium]